jgi:hypothetical protein
MRRLKRLKASGSKPPYRSTLSRARFELLERPAGFGDADNRDVEIAAFGQRLQGRKYFFMSKIPCSAKKYQRVGSRSL